jgi:hypothetical protein
MSNAPKSSKRTTKAKEKSLADAKAKKEIKAKTQEKPVEIKHKLEEKPIVESEKPKTEGMKLRKSEIR